MKTGQKLTPLVLSLLWLFPISEVRAQAANDNPTGPAGMFNGNITTGCSYDPYTGNAVRSVTDIVVAGSLGAYPLAFTRTSNSRGADYAFDFGFAGSWQHSYSWVLTDEPIIYTTANTPPTSYTVNFPDGRVITFSAPASGSPAKNAGETFFRSATGVSERFQPLNLTTKVAYLVLTDGSKVEFKATETHSGSYYYRDYVAQAVIDPYGLQTSLTYNADGSLYQITEPAGRWIKLFYATTSWKNNGFTTDTVIDHITASDGRTVQYAYAQASYPPGTTQYTVLKQITYYSDSTINAFYSYKAPNTRDAFGAYNGTPLLSTCDDPMYAGPMKKIAYDYVPDGNYVVYGQTNSEKSSTTGPAVSTCSYGYDTRTESRGDVAPRTITYHAWPYIGHLLFGYTDFMGRGVAGLGYDYSNYLSAFTDGNSHATYFTHDPITGNLKTVTFPLTAGDTPPNTPQGVVTYTYGSATCPDPNNRDATMPYYLYSATDELGHATIYTRYPNKRINTITYPDGGSETFTYNSFGETLSHVMTSGGSETFTYDTRGLKQTYSDPDHNTANPTFQYKYDTLDRVTDVTDSRGTALGDLNHTTSYSYNQRGQVTQTTHPTDPTTGLRYSTFQTYNPDGTLASATDERGSSSTDPNHTTHYYYDFYKRLNFVTAPPAFSGDTTARTTYYSYDHTGAASPSDFTHTNPNPWRVTPPRGSYTNFGYDKNWRKLSQTIAANDSTQAATTTFTYDYVGNLKTVTNPNAQPGKTFPGAHSTYVYDERNRASSITDELNRPTSYIYDIAGNKLSITRPNGQVVTYDSYDPMNRLTQQSIPRDSSHIDVSVMKYDFAGNLTSFKDPRLQTYTYNYDNLNRRIKITYPADDSGLVRTEKYHFNLGGNMNTYTNRSGNVQTFTYDNRNRQLSYTWDDGVTNGCTRTYDPASNLLQVKTSGNDADDYIYDFRNRVTSEKQTSGGLQITRTVSYTYDADGNRATISAPSGYAYTYTYNNREELSNMQATGGSSLVTYANYLGGNRYSRTLSNSTVTKTVSFDQLNRPLQLATYNSGSAVIAQFDYHYDTVGNVDWVKRDVFAEAGYKGDSYGYDWDGQLTNSKFNAVNVDTTPTGWDNSTTLVYDPDGNRVSETNTSGPSHTYSVNNLNQYSVIGSAHPTYDVNGNLKTYVGWTYTYDAQNRLTTASNAGNSISYWYDGVNRQILRNVNGAWIYSIWDGWNLIEEWDQSGTLLRNYVHGAGGELVQSYGGVYPTLYYYQDANGNVTHLADTSGTIVESYKYDHALGGAATVYNSSGQVLNNSAFDNRFLFAGYDYNKKSGLYDCRNRFYHPTLGRFLQPDPTGFKGDASNLYRYCANNPVNATDPEGLDPYIASRNWIVDSNAQPPWSTNVNFGHWYVYTTDTNNHLTATYGWGENKWGTVWGTWVMNSPADRGAAVTSIANNWGTQVGNSSLDYFFPAAIAILKNQNPLGHVNGAIGAIGVDSCQGEARQLVNLAQTLQQAFMASRYVGRDSINGNPVYEAPAVSDFTADGKPIYQDTPSSNGGGGFGPGSYGAALVNAFNIQTGLEGLGGSAVPFIGPRIL